MGRKLLKVDWSLPIIIAPSHFFLHTSLIPSTKGNKHFEKTLFSNIQEFMLLSQMWLKLLQPLRWMQWFHEYWILMNLMMIIIDYSPLPLLTSNCYTFVFMNNPPSTMHWEALFTLYFALRGTFHFSLCTEKHFSLRSTLHWEALFTLHFALRGTLLWAESHRAVANRLKR